MTERLDALLRDELLVRRTLERYMRFNDDRDLDRILPLFAPDAVYRVAGGLHVGHTQIAAFFRSVGYSSAKPAWTDPDRLMLMPRSTHVLSAPVIDVNGDTATAESDFVVIERNDAGRAEIVLVGRYRDRLKRDASGNWVIAERTGVSMARRNAPEGMREPMPPVR